MGNVQVAPSVKELQQEFAVFERQRKYYQTGGFGSSGNVFNNCTFNIKPVTKVIHKRRRVQIESDSSQE